MQSFSIPVALGIAAMMVLFSGCADDSAKSESAPATNVASDLHSHPTKGPHQGDLVELGNEQYHAEIVHADDAGTVTIYILDSAAIVQAPIDATEITINAKHDGRPKQFMLAANADTSDPPGKSSRFVSNDSGLASILDEHGAEPRLVLAIDGKSYRGRISHNHGDDQGEH